MEKSEKTIAEMEIDANLAHEFDKITEAGAKLQPLSGPGWVGGWVGLLAPWLGPGCSLLPSVAGGQA